MHKVPFPLSCGWPRFMTCQDLGVCKKTAKHDRNSHSMMRSDQYGPITYVALENPFMAQTAAIEADRHINAYATLRIKCGAPHLMRESCTSGSVRGAPSNGCPYRNARQAKLARFSR